MAAGRGSELDEIIAEVAAALRDGAGRLVTAESCTGGWIAKACTDLAGSSRWFRGGAVVYDNELKVAMLGVSPQTLERLNGDVAVAVSGIAGPDGGTTDKPVGTVWFAWARPGDTGIDVRAVCRQFAGDREAVRHQAVIAALKGVLDT